MRTLQYYNVLIIFFALSMYYEITIIFNFFFFFIYHLEGNLEIKLLKRTATFDLMCIRPTLNTHVQGNLSIPKRSNVFIEQTLREREQCKGYKY